MKEKKSYKQLQQELDECLHEMQASDIDIDRALELHKKGQELIAQLEKHLNNAKVEIEKLNSIA